MTMNDIFTPGRNTALDLIRAPLAWTITKGEGQTIGIVDSKIDMNHEEIVGKVDFELNVSPNLSSHGTSVAALAAGNTNNEVGIASVAPMARIVSSPNVGPHLIMSLFNETNVNIINASWRWSCNFNNVDNLLFQTLLEDSDVLVIAAAGNGPGTSSACGPDGHGYIYPASYNATISVAAVGHRYPIGFNHNTTSNIPFNHRSWKDVYLFFPHETGSLLGTARNDKVDVTAPGHLITMPTDNYTQHPSGYLINTGHTSPAAPFVTGVAALVRSANPNLTAQQVKDIIIGTTDDIYHIPYNQPFTGQLGTGRINAYRATLTAKCMDDPNYIGSLDLMLRNSMLDYGYEPDENTQNGIFWNSQDIWIRKNPNESYIDVHENPEYDPVIPNYVNVRVTNRSCVTSDGTDMLELYWAVSHASPSVWPDLWDGSVSVNGVTLGGQIGTLPIPALTPGKEAIIEFPRLVPNPTLFSGISTEPWHFCLVAKINSPNDPDVSITSSLYHNVINSNNFTQKNVNVVDIIPNTPAVGSVTMISNPTNQAKSYNLVFSVDKSEQGTPIYEEAEVGIDLDPVLYEAWDRGGKKGSGFKSTREPNKIIATEDNMLLENLEFNPFSYGHVYVTFNFLSRQLTNKRNYLYHVIQKHNTTDEVLGGSSFDIRKEPRTAFLANAGDNKEIERSDSVTLFAENVNEDAVYNWYDQNGLLIGSGNSITISPEFTTKYKLEIISDLDGIKDYNEVEVKVKPYFIKSLVPNPVSTHLNVHYKAVGAESAYLMIINKTTGSSNNYILDASLENVNIDVSTLPIGMYSVILLANGEIQDFKNLIKN